MYFFGFIARKLTLICLINFSPLFFFLFRSNPLITLFLQTFPAFQIFFSGRFATLFFRNKKSFKLQNNKKKRLQPLSEKPQPITMRSKMYPIGLPSGKPHSQFSQTKWMFFSFSFLYNFIISRVIVFRLWLKGGKK